MAEGQYKEAAATASKQCETHQQTIPGRSPSSARKECTVTPNEMPVTEESKLPFSSNYYDDDQLTIPINQTSDDVIQSEVTDDSLEPEHHEITWKKKKKSKCAKRVRTKDNSGEFLPIHMVSCDGKECDLSDQRSIDRELVQSQTKFIEDKLQLKCWLMI